MLRVDPEKMEQQLALMQKAMAEQVNRPGTHGVIARMQMMVMPALYRWRTAEMNRIECDPNEIANALIALFATTLFSEACSVYGEPIDDDHYKFLNGFMMGMGEEVAAMLAGQRPGLNAEFVGATEGGTA